MEDGTQHSAGMCPATCTITNSLEKLLARLDAGELQIVRVQ